MRHYVREGPNWLNFRRNSEMLLRTIADVSKRQGCFYGRWRGLALKTARTIPVIDSLIASVSIVHHMTLVTRKTKDFEDIGVIMSVNPWKF